MGQAGQCGWPNLATSGEVPVGKRWSRQRSLTERARFPVPQSMREVGPDMPLIMSKRLLGEAPKWRVRPPSSSDEKPEDASVAAASSGPASLLAELEGDLAGCEFTFNPPGADAPANFRFLEIDEAKPLKRTVVLVRRSGLNQTDMEELAYGHCIIKCFRTPIPANPRSISRSTTGEHVSFSFVAQNGLALPTLLLRRMLRASSG